jgi:hypothetical protein
VRYRGRCPQSSADTPLLVCAKRAARRLPGGLSGEVFSLAAALVAAARVRVFDSAGAHRVVFVRIRGGFRQILQA